MALAPIPSTRRGDNHRLGECGRPPGAAQSISEREILRSQPSMATRFNRGDHAGRGRWHLAEVIPRSVRRHSWFLTIVNARWHALDVANEENRGRQKIEIAKQPTPTHACPTKAAPSPQGDEAIERIQTMLPRLQLVSLFKIAHSFRFLFEAANCRNQRPSMSSIALLGSKLTEVRFKAFS
jgi:hypothetical protein